VIPPTRPVHVHLCYGRSNLFLLFASVAGTSDGNVELSVRTKRECARQMPAAVLVVETIVGKRCEHLRLARGSVIARMIAIAYETVRKRNVNPTLAATVRVKADAVRVV